MPTFTTKSETWCSIKEDYQKLNNNKIKYMYIMFVIALRISIYIRKQHRHARLTLNLINYGQVH